MILNFAFESLQSLRLWGCGTDTGGTCMSSEQVFYSFGVI